MKAYEYEVVSKTPTAFVDNWKGTTLKIKITDCDFDKYISGVCVDTGEVVDCKWGYVFIKEKDAVLSRKLNLEDLNMDAGPWLNSMPDCIDPWKLLLSNKNYALYKKTKRKEELAQNKWFVAVDEDSYYTSRHFRNQKDALACFRKLDDTVIKYAALGEHNCLGNLLEFEDDEIWWIPEGSYGNFGKGNDKRTLKSRHFGKNETYKQWRK